MSFADIVVLLLVLIIRGLNIYSYLVIAYCLFSFFPQAFTSPIGYKIYNIIYKLVRPAFDLVYMIIPPRFLNIGMVSLAPIAVFVGIHLLQIGLFELVKIVKGLL
ncbi:YggT family protein [Campylobacter sp. RM12642]|uniref:YggT family protein n=1 Tax=Campylobacter sp. RM12642 TaxID=2735736 RepID=UPI0030142D27|nr:YggT family protein [Campylobacter sp. RM12642]